MFKLKNYKKIQKITRSFSVLLLCFIIISGLAYVPLSPISKVDMVNAAANGTGMYVYDEDGANNTTPHYRTWSGSDLSSEAQAQDDESASDDTNHTIVEAGSTRDEYMMGRLEVNGHLDVQVFTGGAWINGTNAPTNGNFTTGIGTTNDVYRGFDIAYEDTSGDGIVVYESSSTGDGLLKYRTWDGSAWSAESSIDYSAVDEGNDVARWVECEADYGSNNILCAWREGTNLGIYGARWDGSAWQNIAAINTGNGISLVQDFDVAWEGTSGEGMVVYGIGTAADASTYTVGSGWADTASIFATTEAPSWIRIAGSPNNNYIAAMLGNSTSTTSADMAVDMWNGSDWTTVAVPTTSEDIDINNNGYAQGQDVAWEQGGGDRALFVWRDGTTSELLLRYMFYDISASQWQAIEDGTQCANTEGGAGSIEVITSLVAAEDSAGPCTAVLGLADSFSGVDLNPDTFSNKIMVLAEDLTLDLVPELFLYNGDTNATWTQTATMTSPETDLSTGATLTASLPTKPYDFAFNKYVVPPNACSSTGAGGNFNSAASWTSCGGTTPKTTDTITINSGSPITVTASASVAGVTVGASGILNIDSGQTLTSTGNFANSGTVQNGTGAGNVTVSGASSVISGSGSTSGLTGTFTVSGATAFSITAITTFGGAVTLSGTGSVSGTITSSGTLTISGTVTSTGTVTASGTFTGAGSWTQNNGSILRLGGSGANANSITTFSASTNQNFVYYDLNGDQTCKVVTYFNLILSGGGTKTCAITTVSGSLTLSNTTSFTTGANLAVTSGITVGTGATLIAGGAFTISSTNGINVTGNLSFPNTTASHTFGSAVGMIFNNGSTFANASNSSLSIGGNASGSLTNNSGSTINMGTGTIFFTNSAGIAGNSSITFGGAVTISSGTTTNSNTGTVTVTGVLTLTGSWTQGTNSTLSYGSATILGNNGAGTFNASSNVNTVNYTAAAPNCKVVSYSSLTFSGSGTVTCATLATVTGNLALSGTVSFTTGANLAVTGTTTIGDGTSLILGAFTFRSDGKLTVGGGTTGTFTATSGTGITLNGDLEFKVGSSYTPMTSGTVTFSKGAAQVITDSTSGCSASASSCKNIGVVVTATASTSVSSATNIKVTSLNVVGSTTWDISGDTMIVSGSGTPLVVGGTLTQTGSTLGYTNASSPTIANITYNNLTIGGTINAVAASATVGGTFFVNGSGTFSPNAGTITINGGGGISNAGYLNFYNLTTACSSTSITANTTFSIQEAFTNGATCTFTPASGGVSFNGSAPSISNSGTLTFFDVTFDSTTTTSSSFSVLGTMSDGLGVAINASGGTVTFLDGSAFNSSGGNGIFHNITFNGTTTFPSRQFTVNGTLSVGASGNVSPAAYGITMNGGSTISNSGTLSFYNLDTVCSSSTVTANTSFTVAGKLTNGSTCTLAPTSGTYTFTGSGTVFTNDGTYTASGTHTDTFTNVGTVTIDGATATTTFYNFTAATSGTDIKFLAGNTYVTNGLLTLTNVDVNSTTGTTSWTINHQGTESITGSTITWSACHGSSTQITAIGNTNGGNNGTCWVFTAAIAISGTTDMGVEAGVIKIAIGGAVDSATGSIAGDNTWSISPSASPTTGQTVVVFINGHANGTESTAVGKYDGTGDMTGMVLNTNVLSIGSVDDQSITLSNMDGAGDCALDEDIMFYITGSTLDASPSSNVCEGTSNNDYSAETIKIETGDSLPLSTQTITTAKMNVDGTLSASGTSALNLTGSGTGASRPLICGGTCTSLQDTTFSTTYSGTSNLDVLGRSYGNLTLAPSAAGSPTYTLCSSAGQGYMALYGTFIVGNGTNPVTVDQDTYECTLYVNTSAVTFNNNTSYTKGSSTGKLTFERSGAATTLIDNNGTKVDLGTVEVSSANTSTLTLGSAVKMTQFDLLGANATLNLGGTYTLTLTGSGATTNRPFILSTGTFTPSTGTIVYAGTAATDIEAAIYNNLSFTPASGTPTYSLPAADITLRGDLLISTGTVVAKSASNKIIFAEGGGGTQYITSNATNSDLGLIQVSAFSGNSFLQGSSAFKATKITIDASQTFDMNNNLVTVTGTGTGTSRPFYNNGGTFSDIYILYSGDGDVDVQSGTGYYAIEINFTPTGTRTYTTNGAITAGSFTANNNAGSALNVTLGAALTTSEYFTLSGSGTTFSTGSDYALQVANFYINTGTVFNANGSTITLVYFNSATPISIGGTFNANTSTFNYTATSATNIAALTYNNLSFTPGSSTTYTMPATTLTLRGNLSIGANTTVTKGAGTVLFARSSTGTSTFTDSTSTYQDIGAVQVSNGGGVTTLVVALNSAMTSLTVDASQTLQFTADRILKLTGSGTPFVMNGNFDIGTVGSYFGTITYVGTSATNITPAIYNSLTFTPASSATYTMPGTTLTLRGTLTIGANTIVAKGAGTILFAKGGNQSISDFGTAADIGNVQVSANAGNNTTLTLVGISYFEYKMTSLTIDANQTFGPSGATNLTFTGSGTPFVLNGTFNPSVGAINYEGTSATNVAATTYNNLGVGTTSNATATTYSLGGAVVVSGTLTIGNAGSTNNDILTTTGSNHALTAGAINITAIGTLTANGSTVTLTGSGTPFTITGTFNEDTSTVVYNSSSNTTIAFAPGHYYNLSFLPTSGNPVYTLSAGTNNVWDVTIGSGSTMTLTAATNNPSWEIIGDLVIANNATYTKGTGTNRFVSGVFGAQTWTDNTSSKQDLGTVSTAFDPTQVTLTTDVKATTLSVGASTTMILGSNTLTLTGASAPLAVSGTLTTTSSTVKYTGNGATGILARTYHNLQLMPSGASPQVLGAGTFTITGALTVGDSTNAGAEASTNNPVIGVTGITTIASGATMTTGTGAWTQTGNLVVTGTLSGTANGTITAAGDVSGAGTVNLTTAGTFEQRIGANQDFGPTGSNDWNFVNLTFSNSDNSLHAVTTKTSGTGNVAISGILTIGKAGDAAATRLNPGDIVWTLSASGTPLVFNASSTICPNDVCSSNTSAFNYTYTGGGGNITVTPAGYYNLGVGTITDANPASTFTLGAGTTISHGLTIGNAGSTNADILNTSAASNFPLTFGSLAITSKGVLTANNSIITVKGSDIAGDFVNDGTFNEGGSTVVVAPAAVNGFQVSNINFQGTTTPTSFYNFSSTGANGKISFYQGSTFRFLNDITLTGNPQNGNIILDSVNGSAQWNIYIDSGADININYIVVRNSACAPSTQNVPKSVTIRNGGNNGSPCWSFHNQGIIAPGDENVSGGGVLCGSGIGNCSSNRGGGGGGGGGEGSGGGGGTLPQTFTGDNGVALVSHDSSWSLSSGNFAINSNQIHSNTAATDTMARWTAGSFNNNQYAEITIGAITTGGYIGVAVRIQDAGHNGYGAYANSQEVKIIEWNSGTPTVHYTGGSFEQGDELYLEISGTTLTLKKNGSTVTTVNDATYSTGRPGLVGGSNNTGIRGDDWYAGSLSSQGGGGGGGGEAP